MTCSRSVLRNLRKRALPSARARAQGVTIAGEAGARLAAVADTTHQPLFDIDRTKCERSEHKPGKPGARSVASGPRLDPRT